MSTAQTPSASPVSGWSPAGPGDAIRIVPLSVPEETTGLLDILGAPAPAQPSQLTYRGGAVLGSVEVLTLFWGAAWQSAPLLDIATKLNGFFDFVLTSPLMDQMAEYNVAGTPIMYGKRTGSVTITAPALSRTVSDGTIQHVLHQQLSDPAFPQPSANTLYFLYLPPGVSVSQGGARSCSGFCGYHNAINGQVFYAVMPYPGCNGCTGGLTAFDALTSTSSHELCEAITDPVPGQGWYDDANGEIGDICAWKTKVLGGYTVQLEWSNAANACM